MIDSITLNELEKRGVVAVLEINNVEDAVPSARALVKGGVTAIELALRTPAAIPAIERIHKEVPEMMIGIGTVIKRGQAKQVKELGASFAVSPGFNPNIVKEADECHLPFAPGITTASELEGAVEMGCNLLKFFPAVPMGGVNYLKSMIGPYSYLGLKFFPLGGVTVENMVNFAKIKNVLCIGGTWISKKDLIETHNWDEITKRAAEAVKIWKEARI